MTLHALAAHETDFDVRWRNWQARAVAGDRMRTARVRGVAAAVMLGFIVWLALLLV